MQKFKVSIVGANGYAGGVLLKILALHPNVEIFAAVSRSEASNKVYKVFPNLAKALPDLEFSNLDTNILLQSDVIFFATPHGLAQSQVKPLLDAGKIVIDLSADFRIKDIAIWETWYGQTHTAPNLVANAAYGLVELNRQSIQKSKLIAVAGCYPTSVQLALAPLLQVNNKLGNLIELNSIIADCKSGVSGAGRGLKQASLFCEANENFKPYSVAGHRHKPEIEQGLEYMSKQKVRLTFVPHLLPMSCGIESTIYTKLRSEFANMSLEQIHNIFEQAYEKEEFIQVLPLGEVVQTMAVKGSNNCNISIAKQDDSLIVMSVIDNVVKGAAGQAVQCMNLVLELDEKTALQSLASWP